MCKMFFTIWWNNKVYKQNKTPKVFKLSGFYFVLNYHPHFEYPQFLQVKQPS